MLCVNWGTVIDPCQSNLTYTECFASTPKASQNKHAVNSHRINNFEVLLITANTVMKHDHYKRVCPMIGM